MMANEQDVGLVIVDAALLPQPPAPPRRWITVLAFRNRFTRAEKVRIDMAAIDDPSASSAVRERASLVRVGLADVAAARYIDLEREDTRGDVQNFELMGLLDSQGRAMQILDAPITPREKYTE